MLLEVGLSLSAIAAALALGAGSLVISGLKLLRRIEAYLPPAGASRVPLHIKHGELFPWREVPREVRGQILEQTAVFLFIGEGCPVCDDLLPSLPAFVRGYRDVRFVLCTNRPVRLNKSLDLLLLHSKELFTILGIVFVPYAVKTENFRVVEFGVVDTPEKFESILEARRPEVEE
jgi:hypothetical protein